VCPNAFCLSKSFLCPLVSVLGDKAHQRMIDDNRSFKLELHAVDADFEH
jgi:hypothetical protein